MNDIAIKAIEKQNKVYLKDNPRSVVVPPLDAPVVNKEYRTLVTALAEKVSNLPNAVFADFFPLRHSFAEGIYVRELFIPAGMFCVGKIHKDSYVNFVQYGDMTIRMEAGTKRVQGPCTAISPSGTQRFGYSHTDTLWATVHPNPDNITDVDELERRIHLDSYDDLDNVIDVEVDKVFDEFVKEIQYVFDVEKFRELTKEIYAHEKQGFWSDWTTEQQEIYMSGDWEAFSRSRGYTEDEIEQLREWITMKEEAEEKGYKPLSAIEDLITECAMKNLELDKKGEILKSSHIPSNKKEPYTVGG